MSNNQAKNNPTPARLVQGVDVLGGRSFPSDEDDNEELDYGTAAPVEHINFYENKNKTYKEEPVVDSNNDGDNNKDTSDQPNTIKNGETAPLEDTANDTNTAQESYDGTNHTFYVLIGSFRSVEKADSIRTRLALTGIHSSIHSEIDQSSQTIVHQLRIGPFPYQKQAEDAQKQLKLSGLVAKVIAY
ncbi:SPOR domain-containing protein [Candidatus Ichthyocystis sparus]|uniref:SPOR domain-containing protein n=1 Tax=Candidatus Ichthyocystis sparus TaxID=1561004 RepID=UPI00159EC337|nr:SPOR domain-containing protein [Candidatus Ichthyocystis sparus]